MGSWRRRSNRQRAKFCSNNRLLFPHFTILNLIFNFLWKAGNFVASDNKEILRDFDQVVKNLESKEAVMLDARPPDAFNGVDKSSPGY